MHFTEFFVSYKIDDAIVVEVYCESRILGMDDSIVVEIYWESRILGSVDHLL